MPFSIDPPRRPSGVRRPKTSAAEILDDLENGHAAETPNLPVAVDKPRTIPSGATRVGGDAAIHAQVLGEKRGLRAGPTIHDQAKATYNKTHWSGASDRRAPKGRVTKTDI